MVRLVLIMLFLALCVGVTYMIIQFLALLWQSSGVGAGDNDRRTRGGAMTGNTTLNKLAFGLLLALILYVSIRGAG